MSDSHPTGWQLRDQRPTTLLVIAFALLVAAFLLWQLRDLVMTVFAGLLLGILLRAIATAIARHTPLSPRWAIALTLLLVIGGLVAFFWWRGGALAAQVETLRQQLPSALQRLRELITEWTGVNVTRDGRTTLRDFVPERFSTFSRVTGVLSTTLSAAVTIVVIIFIGVVSAAQPHLYRQGLLHLIPPHRRDRAREILTQLAHTLRLWLLGQFLSMAVVGVLVGIGLWLIGSPLVLVLALLAALLEFIPIWGPWLSAVPAVLINLGDSPSQALWVALLYLGVQLLESYAIYPYIQWRAVYIPPMVLIVTQLALGVLTGVIGVALAAPFAAVLLVLGRTLYVEDALGDHSVRMAKKQRGE